MGLGLTKSPFGRGGLEQHQLYKIMVIPFPFDKKSLNLITGRFPVANFLIS